MNMSREKKGKTIRLLEARVLDAFHQNLASTKQLSSALVINQHCRINLFCPPNTNVAHQGLETVLVATLL